MDANEEETPDPKPNPNSQCRLLTLPAELRSQIYSHVFATTFSDPYIARHCTSILHLTTSPSSPPRLYQSLAPRPPGGFNQLKYACRFLHAETTLLEVTFNAIKVNRSESKGMGPAEEFSISLENLCTERNARLIKEVVLDNDMMDWKTCTIEGPRCFVAIAAFCRANPRVKVKYIPNQMQWNFYAVRNVVELGVLINLVVRGRDLRRIVCPGSEFEFEDTWFRLWAEQSDVAEMLDVPNLRFWPLQGSDGFDEEGFRERSWEVGEDDEPDLDIDACLELVREWRVVGI